MRPWGFLQYQKRVHDNETFSDFVRDKKNLIFRQVIKN